MDALITRRGGGAQLNFDVVGGTAQPQSPQENTIWVNTQTEISAWSASEKNPYRRTSEELYTASGASSGVYLNSGGGTVSSSNYILTAKIALPDGTTSVILRSGSRVTSVIYHAFYGADGGLIRTVPRKTGLNRYDVPAGARSIRISVRTQDAPSLIAEYTDPAADGAVWIVSGDGQSWLSSFSAVDDNQLQICPLKARQYVDGEWQDRDAQIYQGGQWKELCLKIIENGVIRGLGTSVRAEYTAKVVQGDGYVTIGGTAVTIPLCTDFKVDLSQFSTIEFDVDVLALYLSSSYTRIRGCAAFLLPGKIYSTAADIESAAVASVNTVTKGRQTLSLDLSSLSVNDAYYIAISCLSDDSSVGKMNVYNLTVK